MGPTRGESIERMRRALSEYQIAGIHTNLSFFLEVLDDPDFRQANSTRDPGSLDAEPQGRPKIFRCRSRYRRHCRSPFPDGNNLCSACAGAKPIESPWKIQSRRMH